MAGSSKRNGAPTVVKKYANRRLYDTGRSSYVTLDDLCEMVQEGHDFVVYDAKTGEDLTRAVLTQIIVEQETREGNNLLPTNFLRQLIGFYNDKFQGLVPDYLDQSLSALVEHQEKLATQMNKSMTGMGAMSGMLSGFHALEDIHKKNVAMFENAMRAMTPFPLRSTPTHATVTATPPGKSTTSAGAGGRPATRQERIAHVRRQIAELQSELDKLQRS